MFPQFSQVLGQAPSCRCMFVRSGTSRVTVLDGNEIRSRAAGIQDVLRILRGADGHGGLGGPTLQDNKLALVWPEQEPGSFRFRFLQVVPATGAVLPMECSNSASSAAMLAQLGGHHRGHGTRFRAVNLSTRQRVELFPEPEHGIATAWRVRFLAGARSRRALDGLGGPCPVVLGGRRVTMHPVLLGNLFLFVAADPGALGESTVARLAEAGLRAARAAGFRAPPAYHPKVIPYRVETRGAVPRVRAASFYHGERHRSMPGSAAMALAAFLDRQAMAGGAAAGRRWVVEHPSGAFDVRLGYTTERGARELAWTEFTTPTCLLGWGAVAMPWRRKP